MYTLKDPQCKVHWTFLKYYDSLNIFWCKNTFILFCAFCTTHLTHKKRRCIQIPAHTHTLTHIRTHMMCVWISLLHALAVKKRDEYQRMFSPSVTQKKSECGFKPEYYEKHFYYIVCNWNSSIHFFLQDVLQDKYLADISHIN